MVYKRWPIRDIVIFSQRLGDKDYLTIESQETQK